jgi:sugar phosphate isomerase/epimerase
LKPSNAVRKNVFVSTSSFRTRKLREIIELCLANGLTNLELSSNVEHSDDNLDLVRRFNGQPFRFLIHHYFPRPKDDFVLNLATDEPGVLDRGLAHCREAIGLCAELGIPFFSVHAGYALHASPEDLGRPLTRKKRIPYRDAYAGFVSSVRALAGYAGARGVGLAVENNAVAHFNLTGGKNEILLLADAEEALTFHREVACENLSFLVDLGHLNVASVSLGFDRAAHLEKLLPLSAALHLSDNDGRTDSNQPFSADSWFIGHLKRGAGKPVVVESGPADIETLLSCCRVAERAYEQA